MGVGIDFVDLFAGVGGFHAAVADSPVLQGTCVFASEIDPACREVYGSNFHILPEGDIWPVARTNPGLVPDHDLLCAGFPCQPFSKSGHQRGIAEARGTLFEAILLVLRSKRPPFVLLENVRNLIGPKHKDTWNTIVRLLRDMGYAVSDEPTLLSPHQLPPGLGSPQVRDRVFIPAAYVGRDMASRVASSLPPLVPRNPFPDWNPADWRVMELVSGDSASMGSTEELRPDRIAAIDMWEDFVSVLPGRIPRFPIWSDVFLRTLAVGPGHPEWKNALIEKNDDLYLSNKRVINDWARRWSVGEVFASYRKLEWQAQERERRLWAHTVQFRPSGLRVRPLTYLPALVAMSHTSIIGPLRRKISPYEAGVLQGFAPEFLNGREFVPHPDAATAFKQFGNAVHVGVTRYLAEALVAPTATRGACLASEWRDVIATAQRISHGPSSIVRDDRRRFGR